MDFNGNLCRLKVTKIAEDAVNIAVEKLPSYIGDGTILVMEYVLLFIYHK